MQMGIPQNYFLIMFYILFIMTSEGMLFWAGTYVKEKKASKKALEDKEKEDF